MTRLDAIAARDAECDGDYIFSQSERDRRALLGMVRALAGALKERSRLWKNYHEAVDDPVADPALATLEAPEGDAP